MKLSISIFFMSVSYMGALYAAQLIPKWKKPLKEMKSHLKNAIVEYVTIHPKRDADSNEQIKRKGILVRYKDAVATIVLSHGFLCDKYDIACFRNMFPHGRFNFLTFDFRGHGEHTDGQVSTLGKNEAFDVLAAGEFVKNHPALKDKPLFAWAFSMGSVATIGAQAKKDTLFDALILDCPYDSSENLIKRGFDQLYFSCMGYRFDIPGKTILQKYALHPYVQSFVQSVLKVVLNWDTKHVKLQAAHAYPIKAIEKISVPCFFIHCKNDEKIPQGAVERLYKKAGGYKRLWLTNGRRHFDSFFYNPEQYSYRVHKFIEQVVSGALYTKQKEKIYEDKSELLS